MKSIIHYSEITLKGKNRPFFEKRLIENIKDAFAREKIIPKIIREYGRIICEFENNESEEKLRNVLSNIFGIKNFSFAETSKSSEREIVKKAEEILSKIKDKKAMAVRAERSGRDFPFSSHQLNEKIGAIAKKLGFKINLTSPEITLNIEVTENETFLCLNKFNGLGGLPTGSAGKVLCLLSGGIDSAAAAWLMMKRGCRVDFLHFHTFPNNEDAVKTKIKDIVSLLGRFQANSKLYLAPYFNYEICSAGKIPQRFDLIVFKRFLVKAAEKLAKLKGYKAIITGDNLSQVVSQTLGNLSIAQYGIKIPVLRPLLAFDKDEIISLASKIGTYELSIRKYKDCCSLHAEKTLPSARLWEIEKILEEIGMGSIIEKTMKDTSKMEVLSQGSSQIPQSSIQLSALLPK